MGWFTHKRRTNLQEQVNEVKNEHIKIKVKIRRMLTQESPSLNIDIINQLNLN
jgi:hypothetical protein